MGKTYNNSVKKSLTRRLVLIIVISVILLYTCIISVQTISAVDQSKDTSKFLQELQNLNFEGILLSRAGRIRQETQA